MDKDLFADPLYRIDSRQLRHFLAAAKCKGFTAAAETLNITQPALSRSIQALEQFPRGQSVHPSRFEIFWDPDAFGGDIDRVPWTEIVR